MRRATNNVGLIVLAIVWCVLAAATIVGSVGVELQPPENVKEYRPLQILGIIGLGLYGIISLLIHATETDDGDRR